MRRVSPVVGVVLMVSVLFMAATAIILWVQSRPTAEGETAVADITVPQEEPSGDQAADPNAGYVSYQVTVEGVQVDVVTLPNEKVTIYVPPAEPVVEQDPAPEEPPQEEVIVVELEPTLVPTAVPVVVEPEPTAIIVEVEPIVADPEPTAVPVVILNGQAVIFVPHTIVAGDTMYNVARRLGSSVELMAENGISSEDMIVGETISVPVANSNYCPNMATYVVRDSDTVYSISRRFNIDKDRIRDQNNLGAEYSIKAGQVLCIPSS